MLTFNQVGNSPRYKVIRDDLIIGRILFNMETQEWLFKIPIPKENVPRWSVLIDETRMIPITELKAIIAFAECLEKPKE